MATYCCPLCGKPVTKTLYDKITGIWQERTKQLAKIKEERGKLRKEIQGQKRKIREQAQQFRREKAQLIRDAVEKKTKHLTKQMDALKLRETKIEERAQKRIDRITASAHAKAEQTVELRLKQFRKKIRDSTKAQIRKEREQAKIDVQKKYQRLQYSFNTTLLTMKTQSKKIKVQQAQVRELERQLKRQTTPSVEGLLYEETLIHQLKKKFPDDKYLHTGKGGDIVHFVVRNGEDAGVIVYECKRVKNYSSKHVTQAWLAKEKRKAHFAILVTNAMKRGTQGFFTDKGVLVVHPAGVLSLIGVLRVQIIQIADMKLGQLEKDEAIKLTLAYLQGPEFSNSMESIIGETISLYSDLKEEIKKHFLTWKKRYESYAKIHGEAQKVKGTTNAVLKGEKEYAKVIQPVMYPELIELPTVTE